MPALMRDKWVHIRFSRGSEYCNWASSTASRAWCVCAGVAKMSRISSVRSSTLQLVAFSRLRVWAGAEIVVEDNHVGVVGFAEDAQLVDFAFAKIRGDVGRFAPLGDSPDHVGPGRFGQSGQLFKRFFGEPVVHPLCTPTSTAASLTSPPTRLISVTLCDVSRVPSI